MDFLKVYNSSFINSATYLIDDEGNFYIDKFNLMTEKDAYKTHPHQIVKFNKQFQVVNFIDYKDISQVLREKDDQDSIVSYYLTPDKYFVVGTNHNRVFVFNEQSTLVNSVYGENNVEKTVLVQQNHFASRFYKAKDGHVIILTSGYGFGWTNQRGRYIVGISKGRDPSFASNLPFDTDYINDVCLMYDDIPYVSVPKMDMSNRVEKNIWTEIKQYGDYHLSNFSLLMHDKDKFYRNLNSHKLGNLRRINYSFTSNYAIRQVVDLNHNQLLLTVFNDMQSKSNYLNKATPYFFFILDKKTGETIKEVSPDDTSVYKNNFPFLIAEDIKNDLLLFKTYDNLFFLNRRGEIIDTIDLGDRKYSAFRSWALLGIADSKIYYFDSNKNMIYSCYLGNSVGDVEQTIIEAIKQSKGLSV